MAMALAMAGGPGAVAEGAEPLVAPPALVVAPVEAVADAPARPHPHRRDGSAADPLEAPVPALAPAEPVASKAEVYAAAGAAPPTAPWGSPPAPMTVPLAAPTAAPLDLAPPAGDVVPVVDDAPVEGGVVDPDNGAAHRSRRSLVLIGAAAGVVALSAVGCFLWPGFLVSQDDAASVSSPAPAPAAASVTLRAAPTVNGLTLVPGAPADALTKAVSGTTLTGYTAPVTAVYGTGTSPKATVIAWTASNRDTSTDISTAFAGFQSATHQPVTAITSVPTGKLGGRMSCGTSMVGTTPAAVCFWSDDATFGAVTVLTPATPTDGAATALAVRQAMEQRG